MPAFAERSARAATISLQHGQRARRAERHDGPAAFELAEEEDVVDELADLLHLGARLHRQRVGIGAG